ncbi:MAG: PAS domain-containing sensor histidine kinase, partial [Mariprofundaceae bacterium]
RNIFENSLDAVFLLNPKQGAIINVNPAVTKMLGFSHDELLSMPMSAIHPKEMPELMAFADNVSKNGHGTVDSLHCLTKSGAYKDAEMSASLMEVEGEALMIVSVRDITERKKAEAALQESEEQVHRLLDSTGEAIYGLDLDGKCTFANPACARMLGYENAEKLLGKNMHDLIHHTRKDGTPYPVRECRIYKAFREGEGTHVDNEVLWRADGSSFPTEYRSYPTKRDGRIIGSVVTFTDISERMQTEDELRKYRDHLEELVDGRTRELATANERLQELDKLKSMFIASMSHELRTPLNSIIGFSGIVLQGMDGKLNTQQSDHLGRANRSAKHLLTLITDVIDISKIEAGKIQTYAETFMLHELVEEAVSSLKAELDANGLDMEVDVPPTLEIKTDRKRLLQCLLNYLSNAVKFTEAGKIAVSAREGGGMVEMAVKDTGIGISEKDIPRLFRQFTRIDSSLMRKTTGTGLGLYLTRKLATEVLGGEVAVISTCGKGSTFSLRIPKQIKLTKRGGG